MCGEHDIGFPYLALIHLVILYDALTAFANDATDSNNGFTINYRC